MVVDDEIWVLLDVAAALEEQGYRVVCARNGDEALDFLARQIDVEVVFAHIDVPGRPGGLDLVREIRMRRPDVGLVVASNRYRSVCDDWAEGGVFVPKPCEPRIVVSRIRHLTAARAEDSQGPANRQY